MALAIPLSRFTSRVGGGSAFYVRPRQFAMKRTAKIVVILLVLLAEFVWFAWPRVSAHGMAGEPYRNQERFAALVASGEHPSPETKAAFDAEVALLGKHIARRQLGVFAVVLAIDAVGIYYFLRYAPKTTA